MGVKLTKEAENGQVEFDFDALAEAASTDFAETVRFELEMHIEEGHEIEVVEFSTESRPSRRTNIVQRRTADLLIRAGYLCYSFRWSGTTRADGRTYESTDVDWMTISAIKLFAKADQRKGG